jgi:hypothetical protein
MANRSLIRATWAAAQFAKSHHNRRVDQRLTRENFGLDVMLGTNFTTVGGPFALLGGTFGPYRRP